MDLLWYHSLVITLPRECNVDKTDLTLQNWFNSMIKLFWKLFAKHCWKAYCKIFHKALFYVISPCITINLWIIKGTMLKQICWCHQQQDCVNFSHTQRHSFLLRVRKKLVNCQLGARWWIMKQDFDERMGTFSKRWLNFLSKQYPSIWSCQISRSAFNSINK